METLVRRRTAAKGWVTRQQASLRTVLGKADIKTEELSDAIQCLNDRLANLDAIQSETEVELDPKDLDKDLDEAHQFREVAVSLRRMPSEKLTELQKRDDDGGSQSSSGSSATNARLPKLELPRFKGEVTEWQSFWDQFTSHIGDTDMPAISKFSYLLSLLEGEAKVCVQDLALTSVN